MPWTVVETGRVAGGDHEHRRDLEQRPDRLLELVCFRGNWPGVLDGILEGARVELGPQHLKVQDDPRPSTVAAADSAHCADLSAAEGDAELLERLAGSSGRPSIGDGCPAACTPLAVRS